MSMPEDRVERVPESMSTIELRVNHPQQLFNSFDPSPFYERDLDQDAEEYIVDSADEYPLNRPLRLVIYLPADQVQEGASRSRAGGSQLLRVSSR